MDRDKEHWQGELKFILSVNPSMPGESFNHSPACFQRYVIRQSALCELEGHGETANQIQEVIR